MKKIITGILSAAMLLSGVSAFAENNTGNGVGYGGGKTNGTITAYGTIEVRIAEWELRNTKNYSSTIVIQSSYAAGGPTVDENGDCLVPLTDTALFWNYDIKDENNIITLSNEHRTIIVPYEGNTAVVDGNTIEFPHEHVVPLYADWESVFDNEIYFHYSYLPAIFGVEKAEWDKENMSLLITENATTPMSDGHRNWLKGEAEGGNKGYGKEGADTSLKSPEQETEPRPQTDSRSAYVSAQPQFTDITDTSSLLNTCVNQLVDRGVITGYNDNTFRPDATVTRAEASAMICRLMGFEMNGAGGFSDVPDNEWFSGPIGAIAEIGIVNGYDDGTFGPNNNITYHEMLKLAYCLLGQPNACYDSVVTMAVLDGLTDELSSFADDAAVTRGDMCILLSKLLDTYITTWETDNGSTYYGNTEMTLSDYLAGYPTVYHYFCSQKQMDEYGKNLNS